MGSLGLFKNSNALWGEREGTEGMFRGYSQARGEVRGETPRPPRSLPPLKQPSQGHTDHTLCMALFLVPRESPACLPLLSPLQNWDPRSIRLAERHDLQEGCRSHLHPQNATAGLLSYRLMGGGCHPLLPHSLWIFSRWGPLGSHSELSKNGFQSVLYCVSPSVAFSYT